MVIFRLLLRQQLDEYFSLRVCVRLRKASLEEGQVLLVNVLFHYRNSLIGQDYFLGREAPAIQPLQAIDFMGSSEFPTGLMICIAFGHPSHPGNSNTQNSWLESASAGVIANLHRTLTG